MGMEQIELIHRSFRCASILSAHPRRNHMTNSQTRMLAASISMVAGAIAALSDNLDVNVSIVIILLSGAMLIGEWLRSFKS